MVVGIGSDGRLRLVSSTAHLTDALTTPRPVHSDLAPSHEGHHAAAERLARAILEAAQATMRLDDEALDAVAGGETRTGRMIGPNDVYWASADFITDWRADASASA